MATHVAVESKKGEATVSLPAGFCGQIVLHCSDGMVQKYETSEVRRPTSPGGVRDITETRKARP